MLNPKNPIRTIVLSLNFFFKFICRLIIENLHIFAHFFCAKKDILGQPLPHATLSLRQEEKKLLWYFGLTIARIPHATLSLRQEEKKLSWLCRQEAHFILG